MNWRKLLYRCLMLGLVIVMAFTSCLSEKQRHQARVNAKIKIVEEIMNKAYHGTRVTRKIRHRIMVRFDDIIPDFALCLPLPPQINGQELFDLRYNPQPDEIIEHQGQKYLFYYGTPTDNFGAYTYDAKIRLLPETEIVPLESLLLDWSDVPAETLQAYTGSAGIFNLGQHDVVVAADEAVGLEKKLLPMIRRISEYAQQRIKITKGEEISTAQDIITRKSGSKNEQVIAISALCRQKGIPTRLAATKQQWLLQVYLPPYGWLCIDHKSGRFFVGGDLIRQCQADYQNFLYQGWDLKTSVRCGGVWLRAKDLPRARVNEALD